MKSQFKIDGIKIDRAGKLSNTKKDDAALAMATNILKMETARELGAMSRAQRSRLVVYFRKLHQQDLDRGKQLFDLVDEVEKLTDEDDAEYHRLKNDNVLCSYCHKKATWYKSSAFLHKVDYGPVYHCGCIAGDAYVKCKKENPKIPLGTLANKFLRGKRSELHDLLDPIFKKYEGVVGEELTQSTLRTATYMSLAIDMGITDVRTCHIGWFNIEQCRKARLLIKSGSVEARTDALFRIFSAKVSVDLVGAFDCEVNAYFEIHREYIMDKFNPIAGGSGKKRKSKKRVANGKRK